MSNGNRSSTNASTTLLIMVIAVAVLYFARVVFIPLALAVLIAFLLAPLVIRLRRWGVGRVISVSVVVLFSFLIVAIIGTLMTTQLTDMAHKLPEYEKNIREKVQSIRISGGGFINRFNRVVHDFTEELMPPAPSPAKAEPGEEKPVPVEIRRAAFSPFDIVQKVLGSALNVVLMTSVVIVFVIFILVQQEDLRDRLIRLLGERRLNITTQALDEAAHRVSRYLLAQFLINTAYGTCIGTGLYFIGVPNPLLWGIFAGLLRYIPYLGIWIAAAMPAAVALAVEPGWIKLPIIFGLFFGIDLLVYNVAEPVLYGTSAGISPIAVLLAAVFWTWLWGPVGLLLATPLTVCLIVIGRYVPSLEFLSVMLGDEPVLTPETRFYQRMLAMDLEEATQLAEQYLKGKSLEDLYDAVIIPALRLAEEDGHRGKIDGARQQFLLDNTRLLVEDLADRADELVAGSNSARNRDSDKENAAERNSPPNNEAKVLTIPARDAADEIAAVMLAQLLNKRGVGAKAISSDTLAGECQAEVERRQAKIACITAIPPLGYMHARYLCRRLRAQCPDLKLVAAILTAREPEETKKRHPGIPADEVATSLKQALTGVLSFVVATPDPAKKPALTPP